MNKKMMVLLITASLMAGCADAIPDVPGMGEEEVVVEWTTLNEEFTVLVGDDNNSTYSTVTIGTNSSWLEVSSFNYTATHLSFEIVNNTVIFNNYTLLTMDMLAKMVCCLIVDMPQITGKRNCTSLISLMILL